MSGDKLNLVSGGQSNLMDPVIQDDPFDFYKMVRARCPVYQMPETGFYIVTSYKEAKDVARSTEDFHLTIPTGQGLNGAREEKYRSILATRGWAYRPTLSKCEGAEHARHRRLVDRVFTPKRVRELAPSIDALAHSIIDEFIDRGECEFVNDFALQLPGRFICGQLGFADTDVQVLKEWGDAIVALRARVMTDAEIEKAAMKEVELQHHLARIFDERRRNPGNDIISGLVNAHLDDEEPLSMEELQNIVAQLTAGGFETSMTAIAHAMLYLLLHPEQMTLLRRDNSLVDGLINEVLRYDAPNHGNLRIAVRDTEIGGVHIPEGSIVNARYGAANRDPAKFDRPDEFDITRPDAHQHLSFGFGPHFCVGFMLAKQEMASSFKAILSRMDNIQLSRPLPNPAHDPSFFLRPLKRLDISFTSRQSGA